MRGRRGALDDDRQDPALLPPIRVPEHVPDERARLPVDHPPVRPPRCGGSHREDQRPLPSEPLCTPVDQEDVVDLTEDVVESHLQGGKVP